MRGMLLSFSVFLFVYCGPSERTRALHEAAVSMIGPIPEAPRDAADSEALVSLGKRLFMDPVLSADRSVSCQTCHQLGVRGSGTDNRRVSVGVGGKEGVRNSPTVWNAAFHTAQFWDGRAPDLETQALQPMVNPVEMGFANHGEALRRLQQHAEYPGLFRAAFPGERQPISTTTLTQALAAFQRTLTTSDRFDRFQRGDLEALNGRELKGLALFMELGCISCHNGPLLGGNSFRRVGGVIPYENTTDMGRYAITGVEADRYVFKVPSLRNVELTAPYFHDGSRPTLESAIITMGRLQLGKELNRLQVRYLADYLRTLTDDRLKPAAE